MRSSNAARTLMLGAMLLASAACAQYPKAEVLPPTGAEDPYRLDDLAMNPGNSDGSFVFLALSGGGTRAAAFSYGAMQKLAQARLA